MAFVTPFLLVGLGGLWIAGHGLLRGDLAQAGVAGLVGLIFTWVSLGILRARKTAAARHREQQEIRARYPHEPWMWRPEWQTGRIESSQRTLMITAVAFALFWNVIAWPVAVGVLLDTGAEPVVWLVLIFPIVGLGLGTWAVREAIRVRKFGISVFELAHVPGVVGRGIGGLVRTTVPLRPDEGFLVRLSCIHRRTTGSGDDRSTSESVLWQESETVTDIDDDPEGDGVMVPVAFRIPADARSSDDSDSNDELLWRLEAAASVPGVDYKATFEVPVYRTAESVQADAELPGRSEPPVAAEPFAQPPESRIRVRHYGRDVDIDFPAARNPGPALLVTGFMAAFSGFVWLMTAMDAPLLFPAVFGLVDLMLIVLVLSLWFGVSSVQVRGDTLVLARGLVFPWRVTTYRADDVEGVQTRRGMQSGNRIYYDLILAARGKERRIASSLRRKREAEWLATVITDAIRGTA